MYIYNIGPLAARRYLANGDEIVMRLVTQRGRYERKRVRIYIYTKPAFRGISKN